MTNVEIERFREIERIFDGALDHPAGPAREIWLREACGQDAGLFAEAAQFLLEDEAVLAIRPLAEEPMPRFGAWQAVRLLGRGGMGTVYLADRSDGAFRMRAAVKVVPLALASRDIEERFRRERQFLASLDHPRIARLIDGGLSGHGIPWLAMEFFDGVSIDQFRNERKLSNRECAALVRQLMEALVYIHGQRVVHRDLKPSNILVDAKGRLKLLDFGTARLAEAGGVDAITQSGVFALTPDYASPEQIAGKTVAYASDIYSAGLVLRKILPEGEPEPQLRLILAKALREKPEDRYSTAAEMDLDLERYLAGEAVRAKGALRPRWIVPALVSGLVFSTAVGLVFLWNYLPRQAEPIAIAVLPFANLSADTANRYISDGFTDEVTTSLARAGGLKVIAGASASQAKAKTADAREAGRALHVAYVLDGNVERSADRIGIVARLERVSDGALLWSRTFERKATDLFAVETELVAGIANNLKVTAPVSTGRHVPDAEAQELVLKARYEGQQVSTNSLARAKEYFQQAIDRDPQYAEAYSGLAIAEYNQISARGSTGQTEDGRRTVDRTARKALELNPDLPAARAILATLAMQYEWDWAGAEREFQLAEATSPNATIEGQYAFLLVFRGRFGEADQHIRRLLELDPFSTSTLVNLSLYRNLEGRFAEAREISQRLAAQYPAMIPPQQVIGQTYLEEGHPELALNVFRQLEPRFPQIRVYEAMAYARAGKRAEALGLMRPFEEKYPDPGVTMQWFALAYASMDDEATALKWLQRSADRHEWQILNIGVNPIFLKMHNQPGFLELERRIGLE